MFDFEKITSKSFLYNLHSHTQFCDGHAPMREFVESAIKLGFTDYGFSPHSPIPIESPCNIEKENVEKYVEEARSLKTEFGNSIHLYKSMEIDYLSPQWGPSNAYFQKLDLDYRIGSVHFIPCDGTYIDTDGSFDKFKIKMAKFFDNDIKAVVESYYHQVVAMLEAGGFDLVGHFDKISQNANYFFPNIENEDWYNRLVLQTIDAIKDLNFTIEINTKSLAQHNRLFPNPKYYPLLKRYEIPVVFNSDAHYPNLINAGRQEARKIYNAASC